MCILSLSEDAILKALESHFKEQKALPESSKRLTSSANRNPGDISHSNKPFYDFEPLPFPLAPKSYGNFNFMITISQVTVK